MGVRCLDSLSFEFEWEFYAQSVRVPLHHWWLYLVQGGQGCFYWVQDAPFPSGVHVNYTIHGGRGV